MKLSATFSMFLACLLAPSALADASAQQHLRGRHLGSCKGVAPWDTPAQATWCEASCNHDPPHCPTSHCACSAPETAPEPTPESLVCQCQCDDDTKKCTCD
ncbi:hypothetical protein TeGR_g13458 [Tetraparma gracilis]|uniref:Uncharacterized protein n=1 Tax=Tetraparma gracilis TaxID=2962635 RepID=A0ABQ6MGL1_9STRA|nr:hypothetical protein TeGR_g13458 [Tetraparma gracilis]